MVKDGHFWFKSDKWRAPKGTPQRNSMLAVSSDSCAMALCQSAFEAVVVEIDGRSQ